MVNLINKNDKWWVSHVHAGEVCIKDFATIELVAEFLTKTLHIGDDAIDDAIIEMASLKHKRAMFDTAGNFSHTDVE